MTKIKELPEEYIQHTNAAGLRGGQNQYISSRQYGGYASPTARAAAPASKKRFIAGDRVFHDKFGNGTVRHVNHPHIMVTFDHTGDKLLFADYFNKLED